jgi:hypothetical protein
MMPKPEAKPDPKKHPDDHFEESIARGAEEGLASLLRRKALEDAAKKKSE